MNTRRRLSRRTESVEPAGELSTRQTRNSARRAEASVEPEPRPIPQRGTRRRRRRSLESVATNDFPKSPASHTSPGPENKGLDPVSESIEARAVPDTDSPDEPLDIDLERIKDMLDYDIPKLMRWCNKMYDILPLMDSQQPEAHEWATFKSTRKWFSGARIPFSNDSPLFIKLIDLSEYDNEIQAKIHAAICSGNLIALLTCVVDVRFGSKKPRIVFEQLDAAFPDLFDPDPKADPNETARILDLGFRIRYRRLVELVAANVSIKPIILAANMFCTQQVHDLRGARAALNNGPYSKLANIDVNTNLDHYEDCRSRIQELTSKLSSNDKVDLLDQEHPQEELLDDLRSWAWEIYRRLNRPADPGNAQVDDSTPERHGGSEAPLVANIEDDEVIEDSDSGSDTDAGGYDRLLPQGASFINSAATLAAVRQSEIQAAVRPATTPPSDGRVAKGKGKAIDIRDAIRHLDPGQLLEPSQKRARWSGNDENEDDDFEVNEQLLDNSREIRQDTAVQQPVKRPRFSRQPRASSSQPLSPGIPTSRRITSEHGLDYLPNEPNMKRRDILVLSQGAQNTRRANIPSKPRQVRIPWTASETARLLDLIANPSLKCSWSAMEEKGGFEHPRNQQALRDKARGLKVWYLEGDWVLPAGFDQVALGQKEKNAVIKCRKNPDRREDDLDENGRVINNILVEQDDDGPVT
ncbi:GCR1-dependent translation factor 1 [Hypoxylon texense]